jgi:glycosyltransferase involved in cell wall biosynthesis
MRDRIESVCLITQSDYQLDPRVRRKAEALVADGYSVDVLALRPPDGEQSYTLNGVNVRTISLGKKRGSLARYIYEYAAFFFWAGVRVTRQMRRRHYAVIDVNTLPDFLIFAPVLARLMGARLVLDMHEITPEFYMSKYGIRESGWMVRLMKWIEKRSIDFADHVITINEPIQDLLVGRGLPPSKSTVIMNAADEARFTRESDPAFAARLPARSASFVMMYHGTLTRTYGVDIAVEAFAMVHGEMPGAELWILGSGPEEDALQRLIDEHDLAQKARLFGVVPSTQIPDWLRKCDVGILSMRRDALLDFASPNKLAEFIIMGKPVAISRLKATRHYYSENALSYFEPNDPADLARQMVRLYRDAPLRSRLADTARAEYAPTSWDVMRERYLGLVAQCVTPKRTLAREQPLRAMSPDPSCGLAELWTMADKAVEWLERSGYASYDPYDVWGTRYGLLARRLYYRKHPLGLVMIAPVILMEIVWPRLRTLFVRKDRYPTADAQLALAFLNLYEIARAQEEALAPRAPGGRTSVSWLIKARALADDLLAESVLGRSGLGWGYPFDWQSVSGLVKKQTPHITATPYCYEVFTRLFDLTGDDYYSEVARSIAAFVFEDLHDTPTGPDAAAGSYTPYDRSKVVNASAYRAFVLFDAARRFHHDAYRAAASKNLRFILDAQRPDGSWLYAIDSPAEAFIDHFHTCFVLKNLYKLNRDLHSPEVAMAVRQGYAWYRRSLFDSEDNPRSFTIAPRLEIVRVEMYNVAEAISLGTLLRHDIPWAFALADTLSARFLRRCQLRAGHWITRIYLGGFKHRLPFLRWPQSQLFLALTNLLAAREQPVESHARSSYVVSDFSRTSGAIRLKPDPTYALERSLRA